MDRNRLFTTAADYAAWAGPSWPSYSDYLNGDQADDPAVQKEINHFTELYRSQGTKFPINTATACQSKWTWSTIWLNQLSTSSCHRVYPEPIDLNHFDDFHNTPGKLAARQTMLAGRWPGHGCEACRAVELAGGHSDRQHNLEIRGLTPPEVEASVLEQREFPVRATPRIVEIFAQNTCNLQCIYCNSNLSSRIEQENLKFGEFNFDGVRIPALRVPEAAAEYYQRFQLWLERNIGSLRRLHLLGGETLLQRDLIESVVEIIRRNPNPDLELNIFSNFNVPDAVWQPAMASFRELVESRAIRRLDLTASIDCLGPAAEYVRSGLNLERFWELFDWACDQGPWLQLNVNQTITAMTIHTMPELIRQINHRRQRRSIGHYFEFVTGADRFQHPDRYSYSLWADAFSSIISLMDQDPEAQLRMEGLRRQLACVDHTDLAANSRLKTYLDELDRRRGTSWRDIFPYLDL